MRKVANANWLQKMPNFYYHFLSHCKLQQTYLKVTRKNFITITTWHITHVVCWYTAVIDQHAVRLLLSVRNSTGCADCNIIKCIINRMLILIMWITHSNNVHHPICITSLYITLNGTVLEHTNSMKWSNSWTER